MSLNDLENLNTLSEDSEEDEEVYIPIPFRFHDLAQRDEFQLLKEEIQKKKKREYNPKVGIVELWYCLLYTSCLVNSMTNRFSSIKQNLSLIHIYN